MDADLSPPLGASSWEHDLYIHLTEHVRRESEILEQYRAAASATGSKALAYVVDLLAQDERRHHAIMASLARSLKSEVEMTGEEPEVPRLDLHSVDTEKVRALSRDLLENERLDKVELKRLRKELDQAADTTLWALLVDTMRIDTDKHIAILRFVEKHAKRR